MCHFPACFFLPVWVGLQPTSGNPLTVTATDPCVRYILEPCGHRVVCGDCAVDDSTQKMGREWVQVPSLGAQQPNCSARFWGK